MAAPKSRKGKNRKWDDTSPGMKVLAAYWLILFGGRPYSLTELSNKLNCSKPTVLRVMDQISISGYAPIIDEIDNTGRKWYKLARPAKRPNMCLSAGDIQNLLLCRDMVWHMLPENMRQSLRQSLQHVTMLLPDFEERGKLRNGVAKQKVKGVIDYSQKGEVMDCLLNSMQDHRVCKITYTATDGKTRVHKIAPQLLVTSGESLYIQGRLLRNKKDYPNTLALHRIDKAELTDELYKGKETLEPRHYFGIIEEEPFKVQVAFKPPAVKYVSERNWSHDQRLEYQPEGGVILEFTSTSEEEVISLVLSFGTNAILLGPEDLVEEIKKRLDIITANYLIQESPS